ncbi:malto-oligosyltrehalose trehalohydrolase [Agromyces sp. SYSU T0242]|uniref:malto-oligosyltrehalose trehalohydrolase n=1 Tax=Agromyces litoreus TaxID=3158561 RepID=UPI0033969C65
MTVELWAPIPHRVALRRPGMRDLPMERDERGRWHADVALAPGDEYGFVLDDDDRALPDPRSLRQPRGVHDLSAAFDLGAHLWADAAWTGRQLAGGVVYELHLGTWTPEGTLDAAVDRLDHLVGLGIDFVELLPVNAFNGVHNWGYDGVLWYAVHEAYGGPAAYQRFVDACHARGLAVIQDVVHNHLGPSGNYLPRYAPYLRSGERNTWGDSVNLDEPEVRRYIVENAMMWLRDFHVDGLRLDAVHALRDRSSRHILRELAEHADALSAHVGRPLTLIAESDLNDPTLILPREAGGYGLTAQWSDDHHHAMHVALTGETAGYYADFAPLDALAKTTARGFFHDGTFSSFRGRDHGRPIDPAVPTWRLVTFTQDHDQVGNRAAGDRLSPALGERRLAVAAVLNLTSPFTPMLFMGEEWGASTPWAFFTSHPEPELGRATAEGRIAEFARMGWDESAVPDPQDPATFAGSKLDWSEADDPDGVPARLLDLHRRLLALRRARPELTDPSFAHTTAWADDAARRFRMDRGAPDAPERVVVLVNLGADPWPVELDGQVTVLLATDAARTPPTAPDRMIELPAASAVVLSVARGS